MFVDGTGGPQKVRIFVYLDSGFFFCIVNFLRSLKDMRCDLYQINLNFLKADIEIVLFFFKDLDFEHPALLILNGWFSLTSISYVFKKLSLIIDYTHYTYLYISDKIKKHGG